MATDFLKSAKSVTIVYEMKEPKRKFLASLLDPKVILGGISLVAQVVKSACHAEDLGSIPGSGRSPGEGNSNPLQYSCLENPMDGGAWQATVHGVAKSQKQPSD